MCVCEIEWERERSCCVKINQGRHLSCHVTQMEQIKQRFKSEMSSAKKILPTKNKKSYKNVCTGVPRSIPKLQLRNSVKNCSVNSVNTDIRDTLINRSKISQISDILGCNTTVQTGLLFNYYISSFRGFWNKLCNAGTYKKDNEGENWEANCLSKIKL